MASKTDSKQNQNLLAALTYLGGFITGIIFLLVEKKNKFIRFHAMQSTITFGGIFILHIIGTFIPLLGWVLGALLSIVSLILWIILMIKAYQGEMYKLPYIGDLAEKQLQKM